MKQIKQLGLLVIVLLLAACGSLPTDGLTSFMASNTSDSEQSLSLKEYYEMQTSQCSGEMDLQTNMLKISYELKEQDTILDSQRQQLFLFGNGAPLLPHLDLRQEGLVNLRCEGDGVLTAVPTYWKVEEGTTITGWAGGLSLPKLTLELPSGETKTVENINLHGFLSPSFETEASIGFDEFFAMQQELYRNYPDGRFIEQMALSSGLSAENAARMAELYTKGGDMNSNQQLLMDIITSADKTFIASVVGGTVEALRGVGMSAADIDQLFQQETNGRISVKFDGETGPWQFEVTDQDGRGNVQVAATTQAEQADGGSSDNTPPPSGGSSGGGGAPPPSGGGAGGGAGGGRTWGGFFRDLLWNGLQGAAAGATIGAIEGLGVGAGPGAVIGGAAGVVYTIAGGFWDPSNSNPAYPPCNSPGVYC